MNNLYYRMFSKYGAALSSRLYADQIRAIRTELAKVEAGEQPKRMPDSFTQLAFDMIICDYYAERENGKA